MAGTSAKTELRHPTDTANWSPGKLAVVAAITLATALTIIYFLASAIGER